MPIIVYTFGYCVEIGHFAVGGNFYPEPGFSGDPKTHQLVEPLEKVEFYLENTSFSKNTEKRRVPVRKDGVAKSEAQKPYVTVFRGTDG